jgi:predicted transcriptional regulator
MRGILREQSQVLSAIAAQLTKIEERSPVLESIGRSLAAIEKHMRDLIQSRSVQSGPDSAADRQRKSG